MGSKVVPLLAYKGDHAVQVMLIQVAEGVEQEGVQHGCW